MFTLPPGVIRFMDVFRKNGFHIYAVGGAVRNLLLSKSADNWDFTTDATPEKIQELFPEAYYNNTYGTVSVIDKEDKMLYEVTPFRREGDYKDSRHPETVAWAQTLEEDLARRDFTINAMAYDGTQIIDPFGGRKHLEEKLIVAVGDPEKRFGEDALRLMRAIRFASQLGFLIEDKTRKAIAKHSALIAKVSWERIRDELLKIIASEHPAEGILFLHNTGLLKYILPELEECFAVPQKSPKRHHIYDVGTHSVMALKHCPSKDTVTRLATLLHDVGKARTFRKDEESGLITFYNHEVAGEHAVREIAKRLRLSREQSTKLVTLVKHHQFTVSEIITDKAVRRFIRDVGKDFVQDMFDLRTGDRIGSGATPTSWRFELFKKRVVEVQKEPFKVTDLKVDGKDVMETLEIKPSREVGDVLDTLFADVVEGKLKNEREPLLEELKKIRQSRSSSQKAGETP